MRIIAGTARGRKFDSPKGDSTRPTADMTKEALFGMIQFTIVDCIVLDLFSGTGSLAFEAISRGAKNAICNDNDQQSVSLIKSNTKLLGFANQIQTQNLDFKQCIEQLSQNKNNKFDFIFLDPPYDFEKQHYLMYLIFNSEILNDQNPNARIIFEHSKKQDMPFKDKIVKTKNYGKAALTVYKL